MTRDEAIKKLSNRGRSFNASAAADLVDDLAALGLFNLGTQDESVRVIESRRRPDLAKISRNARVQFRYDELMREGKHGHYETMFRVVREEIERDRLSR